MRSAMNNSIMKQEYEKLDKWLRMPSASPANVETSLIQWL